MHVVGNTMKFMFGKTKKILLSLRYKPEKATISKITSAERT